MHHTMTSWAWRPKAGVLSCEQVTVNLESMRDHVTLTERQCSVGSEVMLRRRSWLEWMMNLYRWMYCVWVKRKQQQRSLHEGKKSKGFGKDEFSVGQPFIPGGSPEYMWSSWVPETVGRSTISLWLCIYEIWLGLFQKPLIFFGYRNLKAP